MPADLSVSKNIIDAWAQGRQEALARQQNQEKLTKEAQDLQMRKDAEAEQVKQFNETFQQHQKQIDNEHELQKLQAEIGRAAALQSLASYSAQFGVPAPGATESSNQPDNSTVEIRPGVFAPRSVQYHSSFGDYTAPTPAGITQQKIDEQRSLFPVTLDQTTQLKKAESDITTKGQIEVNNTESTNRIKEDNNKYANDLKLANLRAQTELNLAGMKAQGNSIDQFWTHRPLDPVALKTFGGKPGDTFGDVLGDGAQLPTAARDKLYQQNTLESDILEALQLLEPAQGKERYDDYFLGAIKGSLTDKVNRVRGQEDPFANELRPVLGRIFVSGKITGGYGAAFSPAEQKILESYNTGTDRSVPPDAARNIIHKMLDIVRRDRVALISSVGTVKGNSVPSLDSGITPVRIVPPQGKGK